MSRSHACSFSSSSPSVAAVFRARRLGQNVDQMTGNFLGTHVAVQEFLQRSGFAVRDPAGDDEIEKAQVG